MSHYETDPNTTPVRINTFARARKTWRRDGEVRSLANEDDFLRDFTPAAVRRRR